MEDTQAIAEILISVFNAGGPWAALGAVLVGLLRLLRLPLVQTLLAAINPKLSWNAWPTWAKWAMPFILALGGALIPALIAGGSWPVALAGAIAAGVSAIGMHEGTKAAGKALDNASMNRNSEYQPGPIRKAISPVLPVDKKLLKKKLLDSMQG